MTDKLQEWRDSHPITEIDYQGQRYPKFDSSGKQFMGVSPETKEPMYAGKLHITPHQIIISDTDKELMRNGW